MAATKREAPYPWKPWKVPAELQQYKNGYLPAKSLKNIRGGGQLWVTAANDWNRMWRAANKDGVTIRNVSRGYRSYSTQLSMFRDRYQNKPSGRRPVITRTWLKQTWWLKKGKSPSAVPGTSPHGWGCAQDINHKDPKVFRWMCRNAPNFNFYMQAPKDSKWREDWHWHWIPPNP